MKNHSCDLKGPQNEGRHSSLGHAVNDTDATAASSRLLLLFGLQHCEPKKTLECYIYIYIYRVAQKKVNLFDLF